MTSLFLKQNSNEDDMVLFMDVVHLQLIALIFSPAPARIAAASPTTPCG